MREVYCTPVRMNENESESEVAVFVFLFALYLSIALFSLFPRVRRALHFKLCSLHAARKSLYLKQKNDMPFYILSDDAIVLLAVVAICLREAFIGMK